MFIDSACARGVRTFFASAILVTTLAAGSAIGAPVYVRDDPTVNQGPNGIFDNGYNVSLSVHWDKSDDGINNPVNTNTLAGPFDLQYSTTGAGDWVDLTTFCIDYQHFLDNSTKPGHLRHSGGMLHETASFTEAGHSLAAAEYVTALWDNAYTEALTNKWKAAAFQVLIWEAITDITFAVEGSSDIFDGFDIDSGSSEPTNDFYLRGNVNSLLLSTAQEWHDNINSGTWRASNNIQLLVNSSSQNLVGIVTGPIPQDDPDNSNEVPAPAMGFLMTLGAVAINRLRRRK